MTHALKAARRACAVALALALVSVLLLSTSSAQAATYQELRNARTLKRGMGCGAGRLSSERAHGWNPRASPTNAVVNAAAMCQLGACKKQFCN
ncbi:hypothetical protein [Streptomyces mirabilis]